MAGPLATCRVEGVVCLPAPWNRTGRRVGPAWVSVGTTEDDDTTVLGHR